MGAGLSLRHKTVHSKVDRQMQPAAEQERGSWEPAFAPVQRGSKFPNKPFWCRQTTVDESRADTPARDELRQTNSEDSLLTWPLQHSSMRSSAPKAAIKAVGCIHGGGMRIFTKRSGKCAADRRCRRIYSGQAIGDSETRNTGCAITPWRENSNTRR
ncbi:hypothetical protein TMEN_4468 [Trichophyton mentagrophytes]|nr:hypothetical protein TMEN_4468 [Trichophyton mentagrophytes]